MASILDSLKRWFNNLFSIVKNEPVETIPEPTPENSIAKTPGLSCPQCSHRIIVSIEILLWSGDPMSFLWPRIDRRR